MNIARSMWALISYYTKLHQVLEWSAIIATLGTRCAPALPSYCQYVSYYIGLFWLGLSVGVKYYAYLK